MSGLNHYILGQRALQLAGPREPYRVCRLFQPSNAVQRTFSTVAHLVVGVSRRTSSRLQHGCGFPRPGFVHLMVDIDFIHSHSHRMQFKMLHGPGQNSYFYTKISQPPSLLLNNICTKIVCSQLWFFTSNITLH